MALAKRVAAWTLVLAAALPVAAAAQTCTPGGAPDWMATVPLTTSSGPILPATAQAMVSQRQPELGMLLSQVNSLLDAPVQVDPTSSSTEAVAAQIGDECQRTLKAALAWLVAGDPAYFSDAVRRAQNLISWDPRGSTGYANVQEASGVIAGTLALVYDWLYPWLDANQRSLLLPPILARGSDMYSYVIGSRARVAIYPYDSHGNLSLTYLALLSVLLAGDLPQAQGALRDSLPLALHWTSPWGGEDGGFGNGTAYATWTTGNLLLAWYALNWTVGVNLQQKAWVRNYGNFLAYFIPPATPAGVFGDGAELALTEAWARFGKAHTRFAPGPLGRWYAAQLSGEDPTALELLLAPPVASGPAPYPVGTPDAALFPSIGWAAMHSSLSDPARVSVYFRSSPFGSYNHSHADQNSFVINAGRQALAIESGYYDGYQTPHWSQWYKQTRAQNAITFDGGQGQVIYENGGQLGPGALTGFAPPSGYDIVQGDAAQSYGGALSKAARAMVYLRPNLILVYDNLASDTARQWEWNIHALNPMTVLSDQSIAIQNNGQSLCVDMLAGPPLRFTQSSQFTADPGSWSPSTPQWHGTFASTGTLGSTEFIALLRVGCASAAASAI